jgi:hypothetical protein
VFASHAALTLAHILPAFAFVLVAPFFVFRKSSETGWPEHVLFPLGLVVGVTAYAMSTYSVGGWVERSAVLLFNTLFLLSFLRAHSDEKQVSTKPPPPPLAGVSEIACLCFTFSCSRMTIIKASASYFACVSPATTAASLSSIWFQPSN